MPTELKKRKGKQRKKEAPVKSQPRDLVAGFAALVKRKREELEWTQRELSRQSGTSPMFVSDLESENRSPSLQKAMRVANALGIKMTFGELAKLKA